MSDDDCDIFNKASKLCNVRDIPIEKFTLPNESLSQEADYDFIDTHVTSKKPAKSVNSKPTRQPKKKVVENIEDQTMTKSAQQNKLKSAGNVEPTRALSPVSQLILEMEERHVKDQIDNAPVARRTRSSLSKADLSTEIEDTPNSCALPPPKPQKRGRGRKAKNSHENQRASKATDNANGIALETVANRRQLSEFAARAQVTDSIDLVSAVMPRVEGFVNLDSDEEPISNDVQPEGNDIDWDNDNYLIDIGLNWLGEMQMYKLRQYQHFSNLFEEVAKRNKVNLDDVVINLDDHFVKPFETPRKIGLKSYHTLGGRAIKSNNNNNIKKSKADTYNLMALSMKPKKFQLKVQADKMKHPLIIPMKKIETFSVLYIQCAEELNCDVREIQLFFDGELLDPKDTPINQDMEGNEMIDMRVKN